MTKKSDKTASATPTEAIPARRTAPFAVSSFADWFDQWPDLFAERLPARWAALGGESAIRVEEFVDGDSLVIRGELPDVDPEKDVDVTVDNGRLHISARREQRREVTEDGFRSEFRYGSYQRTITLPEGASAEDVKASYKDGILEIRVPIDREAAGRVRVPVSR